MYRKKEEAEAFKTVSLSDGSKIGVKQFIMLFIPTTQDILFIVFRGNTNTVSAKDETNNE